MAFPDGVPTTLVQYMAATPAGGGPAQGTVTFELTVDAIALSDVAVVFTGGGVYSFDEQGRLVDDEGNVGVRLIPNDLPYANPLKSRWLVTDRIAGAPVRSYYISLSVDQPEADLATIQQMDAGQAEYTAVVGPKGLSAYEQWLAEGNDGTEDDFLASLIGPPGSEADAQAYTDSAVADEVQRSDLAYDPAGAATAARTAAISAAATDATAKANAAQAGAISTAGTDATTKAGNAQTTAVSAAASSAAALYLPKAILTVDAFMAQAGTKVFGHRGAGMVAPEHTEAAYDYAISHGIQAVELSVNVDSEGQLWCQHDLTVDRTTYSTGALNTYPSTGVANKVLTNGKLMLGPGWTDQPMVPLRQMLDKYLGRVVLFLEPKGNDAVVPVQNLLTTSYPHAPASVVWKAHVGTSFVWPKANGFRTWCYVDDASSDAVLDGKDSLVDYWGVPTSMPSARRQQIVQRPGGKPVFSWPVYRRSQRTALEADGVVGMMASDPVYVRGTTAQATASRWDQQVKESGGTPQTDYNEAAALKFSDGGWVSINRSRGTYGLGRYCPIAPGAGGYRIQIEMKYDQTNTADLAVHGGLYLGKAADDPYEFNTINPSNGYHLILRHNGVLRLYRHVTTQTGGIQLGATDIGTDAPVAGQSMTIQIDVTPTTIEGRRLGNAAWTTGPIADASYRGGYFGLSNGSITDTASRPFWRNLVITQL